MGFFDDIRHGIEDAGNKVASTAASAANTVAGGVTSAAD
jgi:hypothetical protein